MVSPKAVGDRALGLSDRGHSWGSALPASGSSHVSNDCLKLEQMFELGKSGLLKTFRCGKKNTPSPARKTEAVLRSPHAPKVRNPVVRALPHAVAHERSPLCQSGLGERPVDASDRRGGFSRISSPASLVPSVSNHVLGRKSRLRII